MSEDLDVTRRDDDAQGEAQRAWMRYGQGRIRPADSNATRDTSGMALRDPADLVPPQLPTVPGPLGDDVRWTAGSWIGGGGGGDVFAVEDQRLGRPVAVKVLPVTDSAHPARVERFIAEARTTAALDHSSVLPIHDLGRTEDGRVWFTMRLTTGRPLSDLIDVLSSGGAPDPVATIADRIAMMVRICDAIAYAHSRGILHCDLKPANIMIGEYGEVLVVDWGSAMRRGQRGRAAGTPLYMSPEQARAQDVDDRCDVFGIGATLWHLLLLRPPLLSDSDSERFWRRKLAGEIDVPTAAEISALPGSLLDIVRRAVAADPDDRFPSMIALRDALRDWLRCREAEAVVEANGRHLEQLEREGNHNGFVRVELELRRAIELAPALGHAREMLTRATAAHARFAIANGDLGLAAGMVDPSSSGHRPVIAELAAALERRRRLKILSWAAGAIAVLALMLLGTWLWTEHRARFGIWQSISDIDCRSTAAASSLSSGGWRPEERKPIGTTTDGVVLDKQQALFLPVVERGNVRLTAQVVWGKDIDGLELMLHASDESPAGFWGYPPCFVCQFGGFKGRNCSIGMARRPGDMVILAEVPKAFESGRRYQLTFEFDDGTLRLLVDGLEILRHHEVMPLGDDAFRHLCVRTWADRLVVERLHIERLGSPPRPSPLLAGEALEAAGLHERAAEAFHRVAQDHPDGALAEQAKARAYIANLMVARSQAAGELRSFEKDYPQSSWLPSLWEASAAEAASQSRFGEAAALCGRILDADPGSRAPSRVFDRHPWRPDPSSLEPMLGAMGRMRGSLNLWLRDAGLTSLEPLRKADIYELYLLNNHLSDLSPLVGKRLVCLSIENNPVHDITALRGMPLVELNLNASQVGTLTPLAGITSLRVLTIKRTDIGDLSPLGGSPLRWIDASQSRIADLGSLRRARLSYLAIDSTGVSDLAPLRGQPLEHLSALRTDIRDVEPLRGAPLAEVDLSSTHVADLGPLGGAPVKALSIASTPVADLGPMRHAHLESLDISWTAVRDLAPVTGQAVRKLTMYGCGLVDLRPVARSLEELLAARARVDLAPLAAGGMKLLQLSDARVVSFRPILDMPGLQRIEIAGAIAEDGSTIDDLAKGFRVQGRVALARMAGAAAAFARADRAGLIAMADQSGGRRLLDIGWRGGYARAMALASSVGAHLPVVPDQQSSDLLRHHLQFADTVWIGLRRGAGGEASWDDGSAGVDKRLIKALTLSDWDHAERFFFNSYYDHDPIVGMTRDEGSDNNAMNALVLEWDM